MRPFVQILREELPSFDFCDRYINACAEIAEAFRVFFRKLYAEMPEDRNDLSKWISRLTCAEIEKNMDDQYYDELFGILWYANLQHKFNRHEIERSLRLVQMEILEGKFFPKNN